MKLVVPLSASILLLAPITSFAQLAPPTIPGPGTGGAAATTENASNTAKTLNDSGRLDSEGSAASSTAPTKDQGHPGKPDDLGDQRKK
jgi:hypothetical protein